MFPPGEGGDLLWRRSVEEGDLAAPDGHDRVGHLLAQGLPEGGFGLEGGHRLRQGGGQCDDAPLGSLRGRQRFRIHLDRGGQPGVIGKAGPARGEQRGDRQIRVRRRVEAL